MAGQKRRKTIGNFLLIALFLALVFCVFRRDYRAIWECLKRIPVLGLFLLPGMGLVYQFLNAAAYFTMIRAGHPAFRYSQALELVFLGVFGGVSTFSAGTIPMQSYYLYRFGIRVGSGVGMLTLAYIFHKISVFFYAACMLFAGRRGLRAALPELMKYIRGGFLLCAAIIVVLILLCTWEKMQKLFLWLIGKLPAEGKWGERRALWSQNLQALYEAARGTLRDPVCCGKMFLWNLSKQFCLYTIPFLCLRMLGVSGPGFWTVQVLSAVMLLIVGILPNVAGVGPTEFAFVLLFTPFAGRVAASSALILYRVATYFFPFLISAGVFWKVKRENF